MGARRVRSIAATIVAVALLGSACSSSSDDGAAPSDPSPTTATPTAEAPARTCDQGPSLPDLEVVPAADASSEADLDLTSFDGTTIRLHWFPVDGASAAEPAPTLLMGPGWSLPGDTSTDGAALFAALSISGMWAEGYNVLTWDPRGFGASGGTASVNDPELEGRDVQALLDFVAAQPEAQTDADGDPRAGMVGFSYGGGIQLTTAAIDCRVDALVPGLAWHSLETSLYKAETVKAGWAGILTTSASTGTLDPRILSAQRSGAETGTLSDEDREWFIERGPGDELIDRIEVPTLLIGGTVDTLFTLDENLTIYRSLRDRDVPVAMLWFCGGHGTCLTDEGDPERVAEASFAWLDRHLRGNAEAPDLAALDLIDQDGTRWIADDWPVAEGGEILGRGEGTLVLEAEGGAEGIELPEGADLLGSLVVGITPGRADRAVAVELDTADVDGLALGAPRLSFAYVGTAPDGPAPTRLFAQLVDEDLGVVVGNQITPIALVLDGSDQRAEVDLEVIAQRVRPGSRLTLQLVATTSAYAVPRLGGTVALTDIEIAVPIADGVRAG